MCNRRSQLIENTLYCDVNLYVRQRNPFQPGIFEQMSTLDTFHRFLFCGTQSGHACFRPSHRFAQSRHGNIWGIYMYAYQTCQITVIFALLSGGLRISADNQHLNCHTCAPRRGCAAWHAGTAVIIKSSWHNRKWQLQSTGTGRTAQKKSQ